MVVIAVLLLGWLALTALRIGLALRFLARDPKGSIPGDDRVTVMQPILSGDPSLGRNLEENLRYNPEARFLWLIDEDDGVARDLAARWQGTSRSSSRRRRPRGATPRSSSSLSACRA